MSRIGKKPIEIPKGVVAEISANTIRITGPKGELSRSLPARVRLEKTDSQILVSLCEKTSASRELHRPKALWGLARQLIFNMVEGVSKGYEKKLEIEGVGYKAEVQGRDLMLDVGFSHTVKITGPAGVNFAVDKNVITVSGPCKEAVGQAAASIRRVKPVEPYKGKGIKYQGEYVRRKLGKRVAGTTGAAGAK